jgi:hypothetical protein
MLDGSWDGLKKEEPSSLYFKEWSNLRKAKRGKTAHKFLLQLASGQMSPCLAYSCDSRSLDSF